MPVRRKLSVGNRSPRRRSSMTHGERSAGTRNYRKSVESRNITKTSAGENQMGVEAQYKKTLEQNPTDPTTLNDLGVLLGQRGDWRLAEDALRRAIAAKPDY